MKHAIKYMLMLFALTLLIHGICNAFDIEDMYRYQSVGIVIGYITAKVLNDYKIL